MITNRDELFLKLLIEQARLAAIPCRLPIEVGSLVVEMTNRGPDLDGIGWLIARGEATYTEDNTGPTREVWEIEPLSGNVPLRHRSVRWDNADFRTVPTEMLKEIESLFPRIDWPKQS